MITLVSFRILPNEQWAIVYLANRILRQNYQVELPLDRLGEKWADIQFLDNIIIGYLLSILLCE